MLKIGADRFSIGHAKERRLIVDALSNRENGRFGEQRIDC